MSHVVARAAIAAGVVMTLAACGANAPGTGTAGMTISPEGRDGPVGTAASSAARGTPPSTGGANATTARPDTVGPGPHTHGASPAHDVDAIRALHERFIRMIRISADPPDPWHPEIAATSTGIQRQRLEEARQTLLDLGRRREGGFEGKITDLRFVDADHAAVTDCELSTTDEVGPDAAVVTGHRDGGHVTELRMVRTAEGWRVEDWFTGGELSCVW